MTKSHEYQKHMLGTYWEQNFLTCIAYVDVYKFSM
jgi:hypothetical protein